MTDKKKDPNRHTANNEKKPAPGTVDYVRRDAAPSQVNHKKGKS